MMRRNFILGGVELNKIFLICGKICSGKTTYAKQLMVKNKAVLLSVDEIMLALFSQPIGETHDDMQEKTMDYLFKKAAEINATGINVVLDWGFYNSYQREYAKDYFSKRNILTEWHYICVNDDVWQNSLKTRNDKVKNGQTDSYFIGEKTIKQFRGFFEEPKPEEIDVWFINDWT